MKTPFPPQRTLIDHINDVLEKNGAAINTSDTGTGKTLMSVETVRDSGLGENTLVVCPKSVIPSWQEAFAEQGVPYLGVVNYEKLRAGTSPYGHWAHKGRKQFEFNEEVHFVIWDEAHKCKSRTSLNAWMMVAAHRQECYNLLLSATLAENPAEMKAAGYLLGLHTFKNFVIWAKSLGCYYDPWGKIQFTQSETRAKEHLEFLASLLYPDCGGKLTRADMGEYFSETHIITEPLDFGDGGKIDKLYSEVEEFMKEIEEKELNDSDNPAAEALVRTLRARQKVEMLKLPLLVEMVKDAWDEGLHVAVFLNFNDSIIALNEKLGGKCPIVWGTDPRTGRQQTESERKAAMDAFQNNEENVILLNIAAGGVGINLHDTIGNAPRLALISPTWNAKDLHQTLGRVDRAGAQTDTLQRILFAAGTIEEEVRDALERKLANLKTLHTAMPTEDLTPTRRKRKVKDTPAPEPEAIEEETPEPEPEKKETSRKRQTPETAEHAFYNPSSLKYYEGCPSYLNREDDEEEEDEDSPSARGTRMHNACEIEDPDSLERDDEVHVVTKTLEEVYGILEYYGFEGTTCYREQKNPIVTPHISTFGTVDRLNISDDGTDAIMIDYKFGYMPVDDAEKNAQAAAYTVGAFQKYPDLKRLRAFFLCPMINEITQATFVRNYDDYEDDWHWDDDEEPVASYDELVQRIDLIIERAEARRGKDFNPQVHQCEFCGNKVKCAALANKALKIAASKPVDGLPLPDQIDPELIDDPDTISLLRMLVIPLEKWIEEVKSRASFLAFEEGYEIDGFKKIYRKTNRVIGDPLAAFGVVADQFKVTEDEFFQCIKSLKLGELEKVVAEKAPRGKKAKFKEDLDLALRDAEVLTGGEEGSEYGVLQVDRKQNV